MSHGTQFGSLPSVPSWPLCLLVGQQWQPQTGWAACLEVFSPVRSKVEPKSWQVLNWSQSSKQHLTEL